MTSVFTRGFHYLAFEPCADKGLLQPDDAPTDFLFDS